MSGYSDPAAELAAELRVLRRGLGVHEPRMPERLGPAARSAFGVTTADSPSTARGRVTAAFDAALVRLPERVRAVLTAAFNLEGVAEGYQQRIRVLGEAEGVVDRTVRRWVDDGVDEVARVLTTEQGAGTGPGWWTDHLAAALVLDRPRVELLEVRRVVAAVDGVAELDFAVHVTDLDAAALGERGEFEVFYGGSVRVREVESTSRLGLALTLPTALRKGEFHEFALLARLPEGHDLSPHLVFVPRHRCARLDLRVRFRADRRPVLVTRLADVYQSDVEDPVVRSDEVEVDPAGEVHVAFTNPSQGLASGLRWRYGAG
ncbi:hypothetical protein [Actinosynnema sp. NPDC020468]|uniref:hypothetical protein n=1 Tax=Actinosynnema sp. NPDC020468 TaxID=3154488 RepID=UPI0034006F9F